MKKLHCLIAAGALVCSLTGCGLEQHPAYSSNVKYGLRTDPVIREGQSAKLGEDRYDPDPPGVFPLMKLKDIEDPVNPVFAKSSTIKDDVLRDPTRFKVNKDREELEKALEAVFGTPARPRANVESIDSRSIESLKLDNKTLAHGSSRYRVHCLHCHGVPGDGRGPTARWINPHPRDFRPGIFKFQSVDQVAEGKASPPSRADLTRTIRHGIEGTAMPSFALLGDDEIDSLVSYVIHLSLRGKSEYQIFDKYFNSTDEGLEWTGGPAELETKDEAVQLTAKNNLTGWLKGNDPASAIKVVPYPYAEGDMKAYAESVKRGQIFFLGDVTKDPRAKRADCKSCHDDYGRQARFKFDAWGTLVRPNNFQQGVFRGGRRPVDLYYRVHSGINGSGMNPFGDAKASLTGNEIWDVVNFVQVLSYPAMREKLGIKID
jgi:mono/diheme cytochrome c family protein